MKLQRFFPYDSFRLGQAELASSVYETCKNGGFLAAEAMSGFGKTAAVLSGSLLAAEEESLKIIYACRTKRQMSRVMEEISRIQKHSQTSAGHISTKFDYCLLKRTWSQRVASDTFKWYCSFHVTNNLCSYFLNVASIPDHVIKLARESSTSVISHSALLEKSEALHICPYEVARLTAANAKIVVTTYHYLFDNASKSVLFENTQLSPSSTTIILDEAHNLRDFLRDISSFELTLEDLDQSVRESESLYLEGANLALNTLRKRMGDFIAKSSGWHVDKEKLITELVKDSGESWLSDLAFQLSACAGAAWYSVSIVGNLPHSALKVGDFLTQLLSSLTLDNVTFTRSPNSLGLVNVEPSRIFLEATRNFKSVVLLSATISPSELFLRSIGLANDSVTIHQI